MDETHEPKFPVSQYINLMNLYKNHNEMDKDLFYIDIQSHLDNSIQDML